MNLVERAEEFAIKAHGDQKYGNNPYSYHLKRVVGALQLFDESDYKHEHIAVGWLHDVLEDTDSDYYEISEAFGESIADAVWALTKQPSHSKNMIAYYAQVRANETALYVKLADRLTNMHLSDKGSYHGKKYKGEYKEFKAALYQDHHKMWWHQLDTEYKRLGGKL